MPTKYPSWSVIPLLMCGHGCIISAGYSIAITLNCSISHLTLQNPRRTSFISSSTHLITVWAGCLRKEHCQLPNGLLQLPFERNTCLSLERKMDEQCTISLPCLCESTADRKRRTGHDRQGTERGCGVLQRTLSEESHIKEQV